VIVLHDGDIDPRHVVDYFHAARAGNHDVVYASKRHRESQSASMLTRYYNSIDPLHRLVDGMVELLGGLGILQAPGAAGPDVHLVHLADDAGVEDLLDLPSLRRRVPLIAHLRRQLRVLARRLTNQSRFPDVVGQRLFAVDVLAVRQRQVGRERRIALLVGVRSCVGEADDVAAIEQQRGELGLVRVGHGDVEVDVARQLVFFVKLVGKA